MSIVLMLDAQTIIKSLDASNKSVEAIECQALWHSVLTGNLKIQIPAPVIAEVLTTKGPAAPRRRNIAVVPFDEECARVLAARGNMTFSDGRAKGYWKYDMMIAACIEVFKPTAFVTIDPDFIKPVIKAICPSARIARPSEFSPSQTSFLK